MSKTSIDKMIQLNHVKFGYSDTEVLDEINQMRERSLLWTMIPN